MKERQHSATEEARAHQMPATASRGDLRASHADREQVIGILEAAFAQGRSTAKASSAPSLPVRSHGAIGTFAAGTAPARG